MGQLNEALLSESAVILGTAHLPPYSETGGVSGEGGLCPSTAVNESKTDFILTELRTNCVPTCLVPP